MRITEVAERLGTEACPYNPEDPAHKALVIAEEIIKEIDMAKEQAVKEVKEVVTMDMLYSAIRELTTNVAEMAKQVQEMSTEHKKWVKAGKF
jgi:predicted sugar kinase